jgi:predicted nucleic acid-binding protein
MSKIITFVDSGVLITAARSKNAALRAQAVRLLMDTSREFASSPFVQLEVMPKAIWMRNQAERDLYEKFFRQVKHWPSDIEAVIVQAHQEGAIAGLGSMDALHIAAAVLLNADELVTVEQPTKSIYRTKSIKVVWLH